MQGISNSIRPVGLWTFDSASVGAAFKAINVAFGWPIYFLSIKNNSDKDIIVSFDGVNNHDFVAHGKSIDRGGGPADKCFFNKGTIVYVNGTAGTGDIYLSIYTIFKEI